ncbi:MAG TPA: hypothetical protein DDX06_14645 [Curvibacter sp.]|nr:hypothetical protein [Curvibacter sp.]|tara:strand:+ start:163 stop:363 length:201 start_codon:yes stop_codon:yes gene_type:complete
MTDFSAHLARMLAHLQALHKTPGWAEYVEARVADLAARHPDLYAELAEQFPKPRPRSSAARRPTGR